MQRVKFSRLCESCIHDCMQLETNGKCEYFKLGFTAEEYKIMAREPLKQALINELMRCNNNHHTEETLLTMNVSELQSVLEDVVLLRVKSN